MTDGIAGTDGITKVAGKAHIKIPCLWVSYHVMTNTGMTMASDGFYPGALPVTMPMLAQIKSEITRGVQDHLDKMKPIDNKGQLLVGAPKPRVQNVQILSIAQAETDDLMAVN